MISKAPAGWGAGMGSVGSGERPEGPRKEDPWWVGVLVLSLFALSVGGAGLYVWAKVEMRAASAAREREAFSAWEREAKALAEPTPAMLEAALAHLSSTISRSVVRQGTTVTVHDVFLEDRITTTSADLRERLLRPVVMEIRFARAWRLRCAHGGVDLEFPAAQPPTEVTLYGLFNRRNSFPRPHPSSPAAARLNATLCEAAEAQVTNLLR